MHRACLATAVIALAGAAGACEPVRLEAGEAEVAGSTATGLDACYVVEARQGQRVRLRILEGGDVGFSVEGAVEGQEDYAFVAERDAYRVQVAPLPGAGPSQPFLLGVSVAEPRAHGGWEVEEGPDRASGRAWLREQGGPSFAVACTAEGQRLALTFDGLGTAALADGAEQAPAALEIEVGGEVRRHPVTLRRYDGFDRYWEATEGLEAALDDFASGEVMRLVDAEGSVAGRVGLEGSGRLRAAVAERCGL